MEDRETGAVGVLRAIAMGGPAWDYEGRAIWLFDILEELQERAPPGYAAVREFFSRSGTLCIVMDPVKGESLEEILARKPLSLAEIRTLLLSLASALEAMPPCLRDSPWVIDPSHVRVTPSGEVTLVNFGLGQVARGDAWYRGEGGLQGHADLRALSNIFFLLLTRREEPHRPLPRPWEKLLAAYLAEGVLPGTARELRRTFARIRAAPRRETPPTFDRTISLWHLWSRRHATALRLGAVLLLFAFILSLTAIAPGEEFSLSLPAPQDGETFKAPYYYTTVNSGQVSWEKASPDRYLLLDNYVSWLRGGIESLAPFFMWRFKGAEVTGGSQQLSRTLPFYDRLVMKGARLSTYSRKLYLTAWAGQLENLDREIGQGVLGNTHDVQGVALRYKPGYRNNFGLGWMNYRPLQDMGAQGSIVSVSGATLVGDDLSVSASLGYDMGGRGGEGSRDRRALIWNVDYSRGKMSLHADSESFGKRFGPPQELSERRGQHNTNALLLYRINRKLYFESTYRDWEVESLVPEVDTILRNQFLSQRLIFFPSRYVRLQGGVSTNRQTSMGAVSSSLTTDAAFAEALADVGSVSLSGDWRREVHRNGPTTPMDRNDQLRARVAVPLGRYTSLSLQQGLFNTYTEGLGGSSSANTAVQMSWSFPEELGFFNTGYSFQNNTVAVGAAAPRSQTYFANLRWRMLPRILLEGNLSGSVTNGTQYLLPAIGARYLLGECDDLSLNYQIKPPGNTIVVNNQVVNVGDQVFLSWRHSMGGALNYELSSLLMGRMEATVLASDPGERGAGAYGVASVPVILDGKHRMTTDEKGRVRFQKLSPGTHTIAVDRRRLGGNFELVEGYEKKIRVSPGRTSRVTFATKGYGSVYVVTWNDVEGKGRMEKTYIPISAVGVRLTPLADPGKPLEGRTSDNGSCTFKKLRPGKYRIMADSGTFGRGITATTTLERELDLKVGQEVVVSLGLQGRGYLSGEILLVGRGAVGDAAPVAGTNVLINGRKYAVTDSAGHFRVEVPAGTHRVMAEHTSIGNIYLMEPAEEPVAVKVEPSVEVPTRLTYAYLARIQGTLMERAPDGAQRPLKKSGIVVNFSGEPSYIYTDGAGKFRFERLKIGTYRVSIDPASLPAPYRLVSPPSLETALVSGDRKEVVFVLEKVESR